MEAKYTEAERLEIETKIAMGEALKVVMVGDVNCGKTEALARCLESDTSVQRRTQHHHEEYRLNFAEMSLYNCPSLPFFIYDVKDNSYLEEYMEEKTLLFVLCYDVHNPKTFENLESMWLPKVDSLHLNRKFYHALGIDSGENGANSNATALIDRQKLKAELHNRAYELMKRSGEGSAFQSSFESRGDFLNFLSSAVLQM